MDRPNTQTPSEKPSPIFPRPKRTTNPNVPCQADEAHRHLYHPCWSVEEMEYMAALANRHHTTPIELIRTAVKEWDQGWQTRHSAQYILEDANPEKLADACGLPLGVIVAALETIQAKDIQNPQTSQKKDSWSSAMEDQMLEERTGWDQG